MFDEARTKLATALEERGEAMTVTEAKAEIPAGGLMAEEVIKQHAMTKQNGDGVEWVVGVDDVGPFQIDSNGPDASTVASDAPDSTSDQPADETPSRPAQGLQEDSGITDAIEDTYRLAGIRVAQNPDELLVGEPIGEDYYGLPVLENGMDEIPEVPTEYFPEELAGERDSDETAARVLGVLDRNLGIEGDAGTGKNVLISTLAQHTNRPTQRMNFGADVSVFDLVGEKDVIDGTTYYILGKLAKAAIFGHVFIADEINMIEGDVSSFIHAITEEKGKRQLELRGTDVTLTDLPEGEEWNAEDHLGRYIHPEFKFTATANPLTYAGTNDMNDAFRGRFVWIEADYLPPERESKLLEAETGLSEDKGIELCRLAQVLRESREEANAIQCPISHRQLIHAVEFAGPNEEFMSMKDAARNVLVGYASIKNDKQYIKDTIDEELGGTLL